MAMTSLHQGDVFLAHGFVRDAISMVPDSEDAGIKAYRMLLVTAHQFGEILLGSVAAPSEREDCGGDYSSHDAALDKPFTAARHPDERELAHAFELPVHAEREC